MAQDQSLLKGLSVTRNIVLVPVLQYADDTLSFLVDNLLMAKNLKRLLLWFEAASGLKLNTMKEIYEINKTVNWDSVLKVWGCTVGVLPDIYLGLLLTVGFKNTGVW